MTPPANTSIRKAAPVRRTRTTAPGSLPDENAIQEALMRMVRGHIAVMPELAFFHSVPNSTKTSKRVAARMVREGATAGVHDLHWDLARGGWTGLTIEMKRRSATATGGTATSTLSAAQKRFAAFYGTQGVLSLRCLTQGEAWEAIRWYYDLPATPAAPRKPLPAALAHMAAPTVHRGLSPEARAAAAAKRKKTLAAKAKSTKSATTKKTPTIPRRAAGYPVRG